jgi:NAD(P)-dependent dehydrogenase (short-subunit alcohol dehydrogenase family)
MQVFVTGSARGIGKAIAEHLAGEGHTLVVHGSRESDHLRETFEAVRSSSPDSIYLAGDISNPDEVNRLFGEIQDSIGPLEGLVNNAAVQNPSPLLEMSLEDWDRIMNTNLRAAFLCGQKAGQMMKERGGGRIVNISSVHDTAARRNFAHYSVAKAGLVMLTKCMALELADHNIAANYLTVGGIDTALTLPDRQAALESAIPMGRVGHPGEVADCVSFLLSDKASYITGSGLNVDGGLNLGFGASRRDL